MLDDWYKKQDIKKLFLEQITIEKEGKPLDENKYILDIKKTLELINDIVDDTIYEVIDAISPRNIVNRAISGFFVTNNA